MGTRGITEVTYNNKIVVSQYGQWDHYPSGQGITILNFLRSQDNIEKLKTNLNLHLTYQVSEDELKKICSEFFDERGRILTADVDAFDKTYPGLTRDTGGKILTVIAKATEPIALKFEDSSFKNNRLFCEGVYEINLDDETFTTRYNRYQNPNDEDVFTISFAEAQLITNDEYLTRAKCGVYQYEKQAQAV
jgi:hypothetical protein